MADRQSLKRIAPFVIAVMVGYTALHFHPQPLFTYSLRRGEVVLHARSPLPCRFTVVKDGRVVHQAEGRALDWLPAGPGKYRVEAELKILGEWAPWIYANPIHLTE